MRVTLNGSLKISVFQLNRPQIVFVFSTSDSHSYNDDSIPQMKFSQLQHVC